MVTSPYEWKILEWDDKPLTTIQKNTGNGDVPMVKSQFDFYIFERNDKPYTCILEISQGMYWNFHFS